MDDPSFIDNPASFQECIVHCWNCRTACQKSIFMHGHENENSLLRQDHMKILMDCMQICQAAADSMTRLSPVHSSICAAAANICEACAESCDQMDTRIMRQLAATCRACARSCRETSLGEKESFAVQFSEMQQPEHGKSPR